MADHRPAQLIVYSACDSRGMIRLINTIKRLIEVTQLHLTWTTIAVITGMLLLTLLSDRGVNELLALMSGLCLVVMIITVFFVIGKDNSWLRDRLKQASMAIKLFAGEITDDAFSPRAQRIANVLLPGEKQGEIIRSALLLAVQPGSFVRMPFELGSGWVALIAAAIMSACVAGILSSDGCGDLACGFYFAPVFISALLIWVLVEAIRAGRRFLRILEYLLKEAKERLG